MTMKVTRRGFLLGTAAAVTSTQSAAALVETAPDAAITAPKAALAHPAAPKAWAVINNGRAETFGIKAVRRVATGDYVLDFETPSPSPPAVMVAKHAQAAETAPAMISNDTLWEARVIGTDDNASVVIYDVEA